MVHGGDRQALLNASIESDRNFYMNMETSQNNLNQSTRREFSDVDHPTHNIEMTQMEKKEDFGRDL